MQCITIPSISVTLNNAVHLHILSCVLCAPIDEVIAPQVSKPTKDTAEAVHTAHVVNELSGVLQKVLQVKQAHQESPVCILCRGDNVNA